MQDINYLNAIIDHVEILRMFGRAVGTILPLTCRCPTCSHLFHVYCDHPGGAWYTCSHCGLCGDSIELVQAVKGLDSPEAAIRAIQQANAGLGDITESDICRYVTTVLAPRRVCDVFWHQAQRTLLAYDNTVQALLVNYGLHAGYPWRGKLFLGVAGKQAVDSLPDSPKVRGNVLVVPLYEVPGKINGFYFLGNRSQKIYHVSDMAVDGARSGLAFSSDLQPDTDVVMATDDIVLALQLQIRQQLVTGTLLPLICWTAAVPALWDTIGIHQLLFWPREDVLAMHVQADAHKLGVNRVAEMNIPVFAEPREMAQYVDQTGIERVLQHAHETAQVYNRPRTPDANAAGESGKRIRLKNNVWLVDRPDGWYVAGRSFERVSNVRLIPERVIRYKHSGKVRCRGYLMCNGTKIPFDIDVDELLTSKGEWLTRQVLTATGVPPVATVRWLKEAYSIGCQLYAPEMTAIQDDVQWLTDSNQWQTPKHVISATGIDLQAYDVELTDVPGYHLPTATADELKVILQALPDTAATGGVWALITCVLHNIQAKAKGWRPVNIGLAATSMPGHYLYDWLQAGLELPVQSITRWTTYVAKATSAHEWALPQLLTRESAPKKQCRDRMILTLRGTSNIMTAVAVDTPLLKDIYPDWLIIPNTDAPAPAPGLWAIIPAMLHWWAVRGNVTSTNADTRLAVLEDVREWAASIGVDVTAYEARVRLLLCSGETFATTAQTYVNTVIKLFVSSPRAYTVPRYKQMATVRLTDTSAKVHLASIVMSLIKGNQPVPSFSVILQALRDSEVILAHDTNVTVLKRDWWEARMGDIVSELLAEGRQETELVRLLAPLLGGSLDGLPAAGSDLEHASSTQPHN